MSTILATTGNVFNRMHIYRPQEYQVNHYSARQRSGEAAHCFRSCPSACVRISVYPRKMKNDEHNWCNLIGMMLWCRQKWLNFVTFDPDLTLTLRVILVLLDYFANSKTTY